MFIWYINIIRGFALFLFGSTMLWNYKRQETKVVVEIGISTIVEQNQNGGIPENGSNIFLEQPSNPENESNVSLEKRVNSAEESVSPPDSQATVNPDEINEDNVMEVLYNLRKPILKNVLIALLFFALFVVSLRFPIPLSVQLTIVIICLIGGMVFAVRGMIFLFKARRLQWKYKIWKVEVPKKEKNNENRE
jgi:hypothetical protein